MGYCLNITCKKCGYEKRLNLGQGIRDCRSDHVCKSFPEASQGDMQTLLEKNKSWRFERKLGLCRSCKAFIEVPELMIKISGNMQNMKLKGRCSCGALPEMLGDNSLEDAKKICPCCGHSVDMLEDGYWD